MAYTRKQVVTCVSLLYLIIAFGLAGYVSSRANQRSVPISDVLTGFTTGLPILAGLLLEGGYGYTRHQERQKGLSRGTTQRPPLVIVANTIIFIYSTVVITLLGTHTGPGSGLNCGLRERWQNLYRSKDEDAIKTIQDVFSCCGFANSRDMPWPFPSKTHGVDSCEKAFGRTNGCFAPWKAEEQKIAGLLMGVVGMVFTWQFLIIIIPTKKESWLHRVAPDRISRMLADERHGGSESRHAIEYNTGINGYSDRVEEDVEGQDESSNPVRATEEGTRRIENVFPAQLGRDQPTAVENEWATS
ncbi:hypothetical protein GQ44DRAFT_768324 [Phaeosphaeriaceae sp. PMI808]|nr:hypothetical protein GQ44DRAFT_768324 [Phaeosphaeriaceae sp. PMI808]